mmetsp:Transcript_40725/g.36162  ORF Transcript_40725/g.36162 Transcript_40725/m.36162 type:complete len:89 (+) Transcript_40725:180-446(+)
MLKYIAAYQKGYDVTVLDIFKLPELPIPNLPKRSERDQLKKSENLGITQSLASSEITKKEADEERKIEVHDDIMFDFKTARELIAKKE